jgi:hypothetical protein
MKVQLPSSQTEIIPEKFTTTAWYTYFNNQHKKTLGEFNAYLGGVISNDYTIVGSVGAGSDLMSYTLSKNSLKTKGDFIEIDAFGTFAANANNKTVTLTFGSTDIFSIAGTAINSGSWNLKARIIKTGDATQEIIVDGNGTNAVLIKTVYTSGAEDFTSDLVIKVSATGTANDDVTQNSLTIKIYSQ